MPEHVQEIIKALENEVEEIDLELNAQYDQADNIITEYWSWMLPESSRRGRGEKNCLGLRVQRTKTGVTIQWYYNKWYKIDGKWKPMSKYIKKGRKATRYPEGTIKGYAKAWEWERAWETENNLSRIRGVIQKLTDARKATGILIKKYAEMGEVL